MADRALSALLIRASQGLVARLDPLDMPPGAAVELRNFWLSDTGTMASRDGLSGVPLAVMEGDVTGAAQALGYLATPAQDWVVIQLESGHLLAGRLDG